ncbi:hypothetical protein [Olivibacter sp. XZL3]|uniref:hypothetical protein n=1 Tax=Olivibacter sp. XZL3 TaxID=1735116 RepID=UPI0010658969|nr:hypothetical protein [Olivibacter sp. XZL3]
METVYTHLEGFVYPAHKIKRYISNLELFTLLLTDGTIVHYIADDAEAFKRWLVSNKIPDAGALEKMDAEM